MLYRLLSGHPLQVRIVYSILNWGRRLAPLETQAKIFSLLLLRRDLPLRRDCLLLLLFWLHLRRMGAAVRDIMPQRGSQLLAVVGEDLRVVCDGVNVKI